MPLDEFDEEETTSFLGGTPSKNDGSKSLGDASPRDLTTKKTGCTSRSSSKIALLGVFFLIIIAFLLERNDEKAAKIGDEVENWFVTGKQNSVPISSPYLKHENTSNVDDQEQNDNVSVVLNKDGTDDDSKAAVDDIDESSTETGPPNNLPANDHSDTPENETGQTENESTNKPVDIVNPLADFDASAKSNSILVDPSTVPAGFRKPLQEYSDTYLPRGKALTDKQRQSLTATWGSWTLLDDRNPTELPVRDYPNGDVPRSMFPIGAWQSDEIYLEKFLSEAIALAERAMKAMLAEYGHTEDDAGAFMFNISIVERAAKTKAPWNSKNPPGNAGYATLQTLESIRKRLLHAIMTEDTFLFVMGGHSAAAGHGNNFQQSYTLQVQRILEPIMARLGVYHKSHNFGMGGLGTLQNALAVRSLYGAHIDILKWDSGMTEKDNPSRDLFARQGLVSGEKVPVLWGEPDSANYEIVGGGAIDTGMWLTGAAGIPNTASPTQVNTLPYAARFMMCDKESTQLCKSKRYNSTCWIARDDIKPVTTQKSKPDGQASWHPGNRAHQLSGRLITFVILQQLHIGLTEWYNTELFELPDEKWHLSHDFQRVRDYIQFNATHTPCHELQLPDTVCNHPVRAVSEFTPRYNPVDSSIRSIIKEGVRVPLPRQNLYDPPDVRNPAFDAPDGEIDVLSIVENGVAFVPNKARVDALQGNIDAARHLKSSRKPILSKLEPGQGWSLSSKSAPDNCDGSLDSFCGRSADSTCLLHAHNDNRGGLLFDGLSGWLIVNLEKLRDGIIFLRMEHWIGPNKVPATAGWKCENGKTDCPAAHFRQRRQQQNGTEIYNVFKERALGDNANIFCKAWRFEFAIDGKITSWTKDQFEKQLYEAQRVCQLSLLMNDPSYTDGKEKDVELAIRTTGCGRDTTLLLSHIYWL